MYNGRDCALVDAGGAHKNSIDKVAEDIVSRAVLLDVPRALGLDHLPIDHEITIADPTERSNASGSMSGRAIFC